MKNNFEKNNMEFEAEYVTGVRNWCDSLERWSTIAGAYKKRKLGLDDREVPHSFTFVRRDCHWLFVKQILLIPFFGFFWVGGYYNFKDLDDS